MSDHPITGGCQCGAVRYRVATGLTNPHLCHCRMCQKAAGNYFMPLAGAPRAEIAITRGEPGWFHSSDIVRRGFCRDCGTPLTFNDLERDEMAVSIGSLDDPSVAKPIVQFGLEGRIAWVGELDGLPGSNTPDDGPPEKYEAIRRTNHQHPDRDTEVWPRA